MRAGTRVTFEQAQEILRGSLRGNVKASFDLVHDDGVHDVVPGLSVAALYKDWWGDCCYCPSNDSVVTGLQFSMPGQRLIVLGGVNFGQMMEFISHQMRGVKAPGDD